MQYRDLTIVPLSAKQSLVIACDSSAGIGEKPDDEVRVSPGITAAFSLRVPLLELICFGARPIVVTDTIGNELHPTGELMIAGIRAEMRRAGLGDLDLNGSTEENMSTQTTSVGLTVVGLSEKSGQPEPQPAKLTVFQLGTPYVGNEVVAHLSTIFSYDRVRQIRQRPEVVDMLPVGSKGVIYETGQMAMTHQLAVTSPTDLEKPEYHQSAGPATVILIGVKSEKATTFQAAIPEVQYVTQLNQEGDQD